MHGDSCGMQKVKQLWQDKFTSQFTGFALFHFVIFSSRFRCLMCLIGRKACYLAKLRELCLTRFNFKVLILSNHKKESALPWTPQIHILVHYLWQKLRSIINVPNETTGYNCINCNQSRAFIFIYIWICPWANRSTWKTKADRKENNRHLLGGELCLPWRKEVGELLCGLVSATLNSRPSQSHITQNHLVWLLGLAGPYHDNVAMVKSGVGAKKPLKQSWHCFSRRSNNSYRVWVSCCAKNWKLTEISLKWVHFFKH